MRSANLYLLPLGVGAAAIVAILINLVGDAMLKDNPDGDSALERGAVLLALLALALPRDGSRGGNGFLKVLPPTCRQPARSVPAAAIASTCRNGAGFAGFATWLDMSPADADLLAMPDPEGLIQLPWKPEVGSRSTT